VKRDNEANNTMAIKTRSVKDAEIKHIVTNVFCKEDDDPLFQAILKEQIDDVDGLSDITFEDIAKMTFDETTVDNKGKDVIKTQPLPKGTKGMLRIFKTYVTYERETNSNRFDDDWLQLTRDAFQDYRFSEDCALHVALLNDPKTALTLGPVSKINQATAKAIKTNVATSSAYTPLTAEETFDKDWTKGARRDSSAYLPFTNDKYWESWKRSFDNTAYSQMLYEVLDPNHVPNTALGQRKLLRQNQFMYEVLDKIIKTNKGKEIVRKHGKNRDAQATYKELCAHYENSTAAVMETNELFKYIITANVSKFHGTTHDFIIHWFELSEGTAYPEDTCRMRVQHHAARSEST
jgi:hypothetical protein